MYLYISAVLLLKIVSFIILKQNLKLVIYRVDLSHFLRSGYGWIQILKTDPGLTGPWSSLFERICFPRSVSFNFKPRLLCLCSKNYLLIEKFTTLKRVKCIPACRCTIFYLNFKASIPPGQSGSTTLATVSENLEGVFERRLYTTRKSAHS